MIHRKKPKYVTPLNILRQKMGSGGIPPHKLEAAEACIKKNGEDLSPLALQILDRFDVLVVELKKSGRTDRGAVETLIGPIMELKAAGGMFHYVLLSEIAEIVLNFLENVETLNEDVYDILAAHRDTLNVILSSGLRGSGGAEGRELANALYEACKRYYRKHDVTTTG